MKKNDKEEDGGKKIRCFFLQFFMRFVFFIFLGCLFMKVNEEDEERKKKN